VSVNACIRLAKIVGGFNSSTDLSSLSVLHGRFPTKLTNCLQKGGRKLDVLEKSQHAQPVHVFSKYAAILEAMARSRECKKMVVAWYALAARIGAEICLTWAQETRLAQLEENMELILERVMYLLLSSASAVVSTLLYADGAWDLTR
jgi:hypothetical protein